MSIKRLFVVSAAIVACVAPVASARPAVDALPSAPHQSAAPMAAPSGQSAFNREDLSAWQRAENTAPVDLVQADPGSTSPWLIVLIGIGSIVVIFLVQFVARSVLRARRTRARLV
jgi:hypothetical protein